jgi:hypothetical protein
VATSYSSSSPSSARTSAHPRHAFQHESKIELDYRRRDQKRGGGGRRRVAFGDVADLAGGGVGEEPDGDLLLLAVAERLASGDVVRHFRLGRGGRAWAEAETMWSARKGWERRRGVDGWPHGRHVGAQPTVVGGSWRLTMVAVPSLFACVNFFSTNFSLSFSKKNQISSLTFFLCK